MLILSNNLNRAKAVFFLFQLLIFKVDNLRIAENMASLIDGYCSLVNKSLNSIWINPTKANQTNEKVIVSSPEIGTPKKIYETKKSRNKKSTT